jgi:hypothetical protein
LSEWYHTGDEDFDEFLDRNYDLLEKGILMLGVALAEKKYRERFGLMPVWHVLAAVAAKFGADAAGYYLSGIIDPDEGRAKWNEFHDRVYDWYGLEEFEIFDVGIDVLPNPLQLAGVVAESVVMINEHVSRHDKQTWNIASGHMSGRVLDAPAVNPFFLGEQILYYGNPSYRVGTGMGD